MNVLVLSFYELGRQPVRAVTAAAALLAAGHDVRVVDLAVEPWDEGAVGWADRVALSVPMHTAMRLALEGARRLRDERPDLPLCLFGLYGGVSRDHVLERGLVDHAIAGEDDAALVAWVEGRAPAGAVPVGVPARRLAPPLRDYAHLEVGDEHRVVAAVEASRGCSQRCRHCPVPVVYGGRSYALDVGAVMRDIEQVVAAGASHVTFADPDFLSRPQHARRVVQELARRFPDLTFDVTTKVEHVLRHEGIWPEMAAAGCLFVVSAVECLDDAVLRLLDKGHTAADAERAVGLLRQHGIDPHPSFLPFTPWTTRDQVAAILDFVARHDLVPVVDPVQYSLRLLVPEGSLLLGLPELRPYLDGYDAAALTWRWHAADPGVDALQRELAALVEDAAGAGRSHAETFAQVCRVVGVEPQITTGALEGRPRLTEPWFC